MKRLLPIALLGVLVVTGITSMTHAATRSVGTATARSATDESPDVITQRVNSFSPPRDNRLLLRAGTYRVDWTAGVLTSLTSSHRFDAVQTFTDCALRTSANLLAHKQTIDSTVVNKTADGSSFTYGNEQQIPLTAVIELDDPTYITARCVTTFADQASLKPLYGINRFQAVEGLVVATKVSAVARQ